MSNQYYLEKPIFDILKHLQNTKIYVAYSGGVDSTVLLYALKNIIKKYNLYFDLNAIHVHHGISINSDDWLMHCQNTCINLNINFFSTKIDIKDLSKELGIEGSSRLLRYDFIQNIAKNSPVFLAHHAYDQLETFILQWQRGSGIDGLAGMQNYSLKNQTPFYRPFLNINKQDILNYAKENNLIWIEDESNLDIKYKRNHIRENILPFIKEYQEPMLRSIQLLQIQKNVLDNYLNNILLNILMNSNISEISFPKFTDIIEKNYNEGVLLFRHFLRINQLSLPNFKYTNNLLKQILNKQDNICMKYQDKYITLYQNKLSIVNNIYLNKIYTIQKSTEQNILFILCNNKIIYKIDANNLDIDKINIIQYNQNLKISLSNRPNKTLKHIFQEQKIPSWNRGLPILTYENKIIYYPFFSDKFNNLLTTINLKIKFYE